MAERYRRGYGGMERWRPSSRDPQVRAQQRHRREVAKRRERTLAAEAAESQRIEEAGTAFREKELEANRQQIKDIEERHRLADEFGLRKKAAEFEEEKEFTRAGEEEKRFEAEYGEGGLKEKELKLRGKEIALEEERYKGEKLDKIRAMAYTSAISKVENEWGIAIDAKLKKLQEEDPEAYSKERDKLIQSWFEKNMKYLMPEGEKEEEIADWRGALEMGGEEETLLTEPEERPVSQGIVSQAEAVGKPAAGETTTSKSLAAVAKASPVKATMDSLNRTLGLKKGATQKAGIETLHGLQWQGSKQGKNLFTPITELLQTERKRLGGIKKYESPAESLKRQQKRLRGFS